MIIASRGDLPEKSQLREQAQHWKRRLKPFDVDLSLYLEKLSREIDWNPSARMLTDQYAPANLLNAD